MSSLPSQFDETSRLAWTKTFSGHLSRIVRPLIVGSEPNEKDPLASRIARLQNYVRALSSSPGNDESAEIWRFACNEISHDLSQVARSSAIELSATDEMVPLVLGMLLKSGELEEHHWIDVQDAHQAIIVQEQASRRDSQQVSEPTTGQN